MHASDPLKKNQGRIVILGGFLSHSSFYTDLKGAISSLSGRDVKIVEIPPRSWFSLLFPAGWRPVLSRLEQNLTSMQALDPAKSITLIGHSLGGVLGYLYLLSPRIGESRLHGSDFIHRLITLGSPHFNQCRWLHGGLVSTYIKKWAQRHPFPPDIHLTCIAGKKVKGHPRGTRAQKKAFKMYKRLTGEGETWGDGIIPLSAALLPQAAHIILDGVGHFSRSGDPWYGSEETVAQWWSQIQ
jgi:pimeloyl-ACP methyl ester carboxylesterase